MAKSTNILNSIIEIKNIVIQLAKTDEKYRELCHLATLPMSSRLRRIESSSVKITIKIYLAFQMVARNVRA
jgi:hypothetical protein